MPTSLESKKAALKRFEAKHGLDQPLSKMLREQIRAAEANLGKSLKQMYISGRKTRAK